MNENGKTDLIERYNKLFELEENHETLYRLWRNMAEQLMILIESYQPANVYMIKWTCVEFGVRVGRTTTLKAHSVIDALKQVEIAYSNEAGFELNQARCLLASEPMFTVNED